MTAGSWWFHHWPSNSPEMRVAVMVSTTTGERANATDSVQRSHQRSDPRLDRNGVKLPDWEGYLTFAKPAVARRDVRMSRYHTGPRVVGGFGRFLPMSSTKTRRASTALRAWMMLKK